MAYFRCTVGGSGNGKNVIVTCAEEFAGETITLAKTGKTYTKTCPSASPYVVIFTNVENGTYTVSATVDGQTYSETVVVQDISAVLNYGFNWQTWVDTASQLDSSDYSTLADVLADEEAVRELCLEHDCVDYLSSAASVNTDLETVIYNDIFAKWVNLCDYSLDKMYANNSIKTVMDAADKYGYGEWALIPQVPTMTSNTAPYGTVIASSAYGSSNAAWMAFDADALVSRWVTSADVTNATLAYQFISPTIITEVSIVDYAPNGDQSAHTHPDATIYIEGSNDGSIWSEPLGSLLLTNVNKYVRQTIKLNNSSAYSYYRIRFNGNNIIASSKNYCGLCSVQFYKWAPKGNVPVMTSDTAPYGEAIKSGIYQSRYAWYAFDGNESTSWASTGGSGTVTYVGYKFANPVNVRRVKLRKGAAAITNTIQYSDDGTTWSDAGTIENETDSDKKINDFGYHLYWRSKNVASTSDFHVIFSLQFYGRELKVSVPKMTSNTAPYGTANANSEYSSSYPAWKAFDDTGLTTGSATPKSGWSPSDGSVTNRIYYAFSSKVMPQKARIGGSGNATGASKTFTGKVVASNNLTTWTPISEDVTSYFNAVWTDVELNASEDYLYIGFETSSVDTSSGTFGMKFQFFGKDYSEKEFANDGSKWLYDHGVELVEFESVKGTNTTTNLPVIDYGSELFIQAIASSGGSNANRFSEIHTQLDLTPYSLMRGVCGSRIKLNAGTICVNSSANNSGSFVNADAYSEPAVPISSPNTALALDVSSYNQSKYVAFGAYGTTGRETSLVEWWLE